MLACVSGWVHQLAQVLDDAKELSVEERPLGFEVILWHLPQHAAPWRGAWPQAIAPFLKVTQSSAPHLFFCSQVPDLPRTNNDLEQSFAQVRFHQRRATGRKGALAGLVVQGAVRVPAALATRVKTFTANELVPHDVQAWRTLRTQVLSRQQSRCKQLHFRKDPSAYLATLETQLLKESLRS